MASQPPLSSSSSSPRVHSSAFGRTTTTSDDFRASADESYDEDLLLAQSEELLSFLDDVVSDGPLSPNAETQPDATPTPAATDAATTSDDTDEIPLKTGSKKRNTYRDKVHRELDYLRTRAAELESQLTSLREGTTTLPPRDDVAITSVWKRIAKAQLEFRQQSEAENEMLKRELTRHVNMTKNIEHTLGKRGDVSEFQGSAVLKSKKGRVGTQLVDAEGFAEIVTDLDARFARMDSVFRANGVDKIASESSRFTRMQADGTASEGGLPWLELIDVFVAPFHRQMTSSALWRSILHRYIFRNRPGLERMWQTGDAFAVKFYTESTLEDGTSVILPCKLAMKKYDDEHGGMAIVWRTITECKGGFRGMFADETGWTTVQAIPTPSGYLDSSSVVRTCVHFVPRYNAPPSVEAQDHASVKVFTDLVVDSTKEEHVDISRMMESLLLDEVNGISTSNTNDLPPRSS